MTSKTLSDAAACDSPLPILPSKIHRKRGCRVNTQRSKALRMLQPWRPSEDREAFHCGFLYHQNYTHPVLERGIVCACYTSCLFLGTCLGPFSYLNRASSCTGPRAHIPRYRAVTLHCGISAIGFQGSSATLTKPMLSGK